MGDPQLLPFLTRDVPPIPGVVKQRREDFRVEEVPLYEPSGRGTHVSVTIEKSGLPTMDAARQIELSSKQQCGAATRSAERVRSTALRAAR